MLYDCHQVQTILTAWESQDTNVATCFSPWYSWSALCQPLLQSPSSGFSPLEKLLALFLPNWQLWLQQIHPRCPSCGQEQLSTELGYMRAALSLFHAPSCYFPLVHLKLCHPASLLTIIRCLQKPFMLTVVNMMVLVHQLMTVRIFL